MTDPSTPPPHREALTREVAARLRPGLRELSDAAFAAVVARIVDARLGMRVASGQPGASHAPRDDRAPEPPADRSR